MTYTQDHIRRAGIIGEISSIDVEHLITLLDEAVRFEEGRVKPESLELKEGDILICKKHCNGFTIGKEYIIYSIGGSIVVFCDDDGAFRIFRTYIDNNRFYGNYFKLKHP